MVILKSMNTSLCSLIVNFAKIDNNHRWLKEFKEVTNFEAMRHLAMFMLRDVGGLIQREKKNIISLGDLLKKSMREIVDANPNSLKHGISVEFEHEVA